MPAKNDLLLIVKIAPQNIVDKSPHTTAATVRLLAETLTNIRDTYCTHAMNSSDGKTIVFFLESKWDDQTIMDMLKNEHSHEGLWQERRQEKFQLKSDDEGLLVRMLEQYSPHNLDPKPLAWLQLR